MGDRSGRRQHHEADGPRGQVVEVVAETAPLDDGVVDHRHDPGGREAVREEADIGRAQPVLPALLCAWSERAAGTRVESVEELITKLKQEAKVL